jgi:GT2 family glycosyltransferase
MSSSGQLLSVIIPAHQAASMLQRCLQALESSDLPRESWELIVVDDGSTDRTAEIAAQYADQTISLPGGPRGPSYARNRGAEIAGGHWLVFVDADVCVHRDTLRRFTEVSGADTEVAAIFGSYDDAPPAAGFASKYRNLLHHYVHHKNPGEAETFWAGCGAVRRDVFWEVGLFDEWHYWRPQVEDIELGRRIRQAGYRILLRPEIQGTHLKRWTVRDIIATDFRSRGVPWMRLIMQEGDSPGSRTLNLQQREKLSTVLAGIGMLAGITAIVLRNTWPLLLAALAGLSILLLHRGFYALLLRRGGWLVTAASLPLHLTYYVENVVSAVWGWLTHMVVGPPMPSPEVAAFEELGVETWPPVAARPKKSVWQDDES